MTPATTTFGASRRSDLDWLRVIAFGLLILFHVGLVYAPFDWHIHSKHTVEWLREGILITQPWRLTLLFLVSGAALKLMSRNLSATRVLKSRLARLLPPAIFGILILVPPQAFIEAFDKGSWNNNLWAWWLHQFSPEGLAGGVPVNHMWFVLYIMVYSALAWALIALPMVQTWLSAVVEAGLKSGWLLAAPVIYLTVARQSLFLHYGISNHLSSDWYNHAVSLGAFLLGFLLVGRAGFWREVIRWRWAAAAMAALALPALMMLESVPETTPETWWTSAIFSIDQWATIAALLGFGARHLAHRDGPVLRYLTQAVFPCYLAHQTILVASVWFLKPFGLPLALESTILIAVTVGGCLATYEVVRRVNLLRPLFGLKRLPKVSTPPPAPLLRSAPARAETPGMAAEAA